MTRVLAKLLLAIPLVAAAAPRDHLGFDPVKAPDAVSAAYFAPENQILFRITIGSADNETLKFWEPGAPSYDERLEFLRYAFTKGFSTSVSCEPFLDNNIEQVIADTRAFVTDSIWIGTMNQGKARIKVNGHWTPEVEAKYNELMSWCTADNIMALYAKYKDDALIRWKESIAKIVGVKSDCENEKEMEASTSSLAINQITNQASKRLARAITISNND